MVTARKTGRTKAFLAAVVLALAFGMCACGVTAGEDAGQASLSSTASASRQDDGKGDDADERQDAAENSGADDEDEATRAGNVEASDVASSAGAPRVASEEEADEGENGMEQEARIKLKVSGAELDAVLEDNSSARAFADLLAAGPVTVNMRDYAGMEKVGDLGRTLPRNDESMTAEPGDIILYQGNQITVYYGVNSWSLTKLGEIEGTSPEELRSALGSGDATVEFSLA